MRVQWQQGGGLEGVRSGMCVNYTLPPINQGDKKEVEERKSRMGKRRSQGEGVIRGMTR